MRAYLRYIFSIALNPATAPATNINGESVNKKYSAYSSGAFMHPYGLSHI